MTQNTMWRSNQKAEKGFSAEIKIIKITSNIYFIVHKLLDIQRTAACKLID